MKKPHNQDLKAYPAWSINSCVDSTALHRSHKNSYPMQCELMATANKMFFLVNTHCKLGSQQMSPLQVNTQWTTEPGNITTKGWATQKAVAWTTQKKGEAPVSLITRYALLAVTIPLHCTIRTLLVSLFVTLQHSNAEANTARMYLQQGRWKKNKVIWCPKIYQNIHSATMHRYRIVLQRS